MYRLDYLHGSQKGQHRIEQRRRLEVGSDLSCQIWAPAGLAPRHAFFDDDGACVRVCALTEAPVRVNGREVREAELKEGDRIEIGPLTFRFSRRRFRARDALRILPVLLPAVMLGAFVAVWSLRWRMERKARVASATPEWVPRRTDRTDPALRAMENAAERLTEGSEAERLERLERELEVARREVPVEPSEEIKTPAEPSTPHEDLVYRARRLEQEGRLAEARQVWETMVERGPDESLYALAAAEIVRLGHLMSGRKDVSDELSSARQSSPSSSREETRRVERGLRIESVEHRRFSTTPEYEEMRLLRIVIADTGGLPPEAATDARVIVTFYDAPEGSATAIPTRTRTAPAVFDLRGTPRDAQGRWVVNAAYVVPRGFRERERRATGRIYRYHGFVVQVFRAGRLDDAEARPRALAERRS
jgi:hypothetical protein